MQKLPPGVETSCKGQVARDKGMSIRRFEDIKAWQLARKLVREMYIITGSEKFRKDLSLKDQIQRASVSVMSNIAEGFERNSKKEFIQFLYIARGSVGEVRSLLYAVLDIGLITRENFERVVLMAEEVSKTIYGLIKFLSKG